MILTNRKDSRRICALQVNTPDGKTITLMPGDNVIDDAVWDEISGMPYVQRKIAKGDLIATEAPRVIKEVKSHGKKPHGKKDSDKDILG